jgi:hypothetical protein
VTGPDPVADAVRQLRDAVRAEAAAELLDRIQTTGRANQPGLWLAAKILAPALDPFTDDDPQTPETTP